MNCADHSIVAYSGQCIALISKPGYGTASLYIIIQTRNTLKRRENAKIFQALCSDLEPARMTT